MGLTYPTMAKDIKNAIHHACRIFLRPIASLLLNFGMTWKEFSGISKSVFVQAATEDFGIRGRPTNVSRVSILTGISRKEVKRQRDLLAMPNNLITSKTTDATRLLGGWHQEVDYLDSAGEPLALPVLGDTPSFQSLFALYGGDTPQQTLIKELCGAGSVEYDDNGRLVAKMRYHMPIAMSEGNIRLLGSILYDHANTLRNNIAGGPNSTPRFERSAVDDLVDREAVTDFKKFVDTRGQQFLEEVDAWLSDHRASSTSDDSDSVRLGIGLYAIDGHLPGEREQ